MLIAKQLNADQWTGDHRALAVLPYEPEDMPLLFEESSDDLDWFKIAVVESLDGWRFGFIRYRRAPKPGVGVFVQASDPDMPAALEALLTTVELSRADLPWISPLAST